MAGELYVSNLAGTFDYQTILEAYYQAQMQPVLYLQQQEDAINTKISAVNDFETKIEAFYEKFDTLISGDLLNDKQVSVSNENVLSASVTDADKAVTGSVDVTVNQLAQNDVWLSQAGVSDLDSAVATAAGTIQITYAGNVVATIDYDTDTTDAANPSTLKEIADAINNAQDKVKASIIYDGTSYRLLLSGVDTGADNTISISEVGGGDLLDKLQLGDNYSASHVQTAQDAEITVYGTTITSSTNTFTDAIPGVELTVKELGTANVSISQDYSKFESALEDFISAYNDIVDFVQTETGKDGRLSGNSTLQMIRSSILSRLQPLFNANLLDVDKDTGHLSLKTDVLDSILSSNPSEMENVISDLKSELYDYLILLKDPTGPIGSMEKSLENQKEALDDQIEEMKKLVNDQIENFRQQLIQVQLLQEQMAEIRAKLTSVFGTPSLLPTTNDVSAG
ncbi:flagellar hook-associated protein 2 [Desulfurobacterium pacificum]|uniref:Flagellar hook-associated protein 2 n=1 Tax=Desulfurobacterium pacificum TaxID=240166 RepID=A0ABY1ND55_9BACT|nr:flagellar filament capping protein FliD [Desulfurobacterium pacificum]SMP06918.1 flagellar hook-associated protein 2 [Desulfurobacterium pacificum]